MKLSHRDFRPQRRSKYVAQPSKRRPTLRVLLLAAIGLAVYLKFDTVVASRQFQTLRQGPAWLVATMFPRDSAAGTRPSTNSELSWSPDSAWVEAECASPRADSCLDGWRHLGGEALGSLRAILGKARIQWGLEPEGGFSARFQRIPYGPDPLAPSGTRLDLIRLEVRNGQDAVVLGPAPGKTPGVLCARDRCLENPEPRPPFANFRQGTRPAEAGTSDTRVPEATLIPLGGAAAAPILRGRVLEIPAGAGQWVKLHHGEDVFSYYRGFASLHAGLRPGAMVDIGDTLGLVPGSGDSAGALELRIEKGGLMVDPYAFLGLRPDSAGTGDGR